MSDIDLLHLFSDYIAVNIIPKRIESTRSFLLPTADVDETSTATTAVLTSTLSAACSDPDDGANAAFTYTIDSSTPVAGTTDFTINTNSGDIEVDTGITLDYETTPSYALTIHMTATGGVPVYTTTVTVIVEINRTYTFSLALKTKSNDDVSANS